MSKIRMSALGTYKEKIPTEQDVEIGNTEISIFELIKDKFDIPNTDGRLAFVVNGRMQKGTYIVQPDDKIVVLKMGGAG